MTEKGKRRRLSREILGLIGLCGGVSAFLFLVLSNVATGVAEVYCFQNDVPMTEFDWLEVEQWVFAVGGVLSCGCFSVLFLTLMGDRIAYIRKITASIDALHTPEGTVSIPLEGNNELTELAAAINEMSQARQRLREKEQTLAREKEQLVRALSHDIRTPLTSILSYSDYLAEKETLTPQEQKAYMELIRKKAEQIRDLTAVLLDGSSRKPEFFADGRLLMEQIAAEFREELEDGFSVETDLSGCGVFSGTFDVQELRRIFDNLSSNVRKYADPDRPVVLTVRRENGGLLIRQTNGIGRETEGAEGYRIGLNSIRRIAQLYGGTLTTEQDENAFAVSVFLSVP